jgi:N-acetylglutamate synthase
MVAWPDPGTRVTVRYRRARGSVPPLTDAVGHLLDVDPVVRVQTKTGTVVEFAPADVVALRVLTDVPVRTSQIRALEHATAKAWPGVENAWLDGWLLRVGTGVGLTTNSAVPLDFSARLSALPAISTWFDRRHLPARLAIPDRLLSPPPGLTTEHTEQLLVCEVSGMAGGEADPSNILSARPDDAWLRMSPCQIPVAALTAVSAGELMFGTHPGAAVARAAVTEASDGTRWVGLSALHASDRSAGRRLCEALLAWGARRGATRGYVEADERDEGATALADSLGFRLHHRRRYFSCRTAGSDTV